MIQDVHPGSGSRIRILVIYSSRIPDPGVKKAPDLGSGSATLVSSGPTDWAFWTCWRTTYFSPAGTPSPHPRGELLPAFHGRLYFDNCNVVTDVLFSAKCVKQGVFNKGCSMSSLFQSKSQCCGSGSRIPDPVPFWHLDLGSGIRDGWKTRVRDPDPGWTTRIIFHRA